MEEKNNLIEDKSSLTFETVDFSKFTDVINSDNVRYKNNRGFNLDGFNFEIDEFLDDNIERDKIISTDNEEFQSKLMDYIDNNLDRLLENSNVRDNIKPANNYYTKKLMETEGYDERSAILNSLYFIFIIYIMMG